MDGAGSQENAPNFVVRDNNLRKSAGAGGKQPLAKCLGGEKDNKNGGLEKAGRDTNLSATLAKGRQKAWGSGTLKPGARRMSETYKPT